jgi:hypothetical protein
MSGVARCSWTTQSAAGKLARLRVQECAVYDISSPEPRVPDPGESVPSPCINVCTIDPNTGWCLGCYRSLHEIAGWLDFSTAEKRAVLARLAARRAAQ